MSFNSIGTIELSGFREYEDTSGVSVPTTRSGDTKARGEAKNQKPELKQIR